MSPHRTRAIIEHRRAQRAGKALADLGRQQRAEQRRSLRDQLVAAGFIVPCGGDDPEAA